MKGKLVLLGLLVILIAGLVASYMVRPLLFQRVAWHAKKAVQSVYMHETKKMDIPLITQTRNLNCESTTAQMILKYYGKNTDLDTIQGMLPLDKNPHKGLEMIKKLIFITREGYGLSYKKVPNNFFEKNILQRGIKRLSYCQNENKVFKELLNADFLTINDREYKNPLMLLSKFLDRKNEFEVEYLSDCIHGDLHLDNILISGNDFIFLDLKGTEEKWDVLYDLSRIVWSYGFCNHEEFTIKKIEENNYSIFMKDKDLDAKWQSLCVEIEKSIEELNKSRFRLMIAVHYLAACGPYTASNNPQAAMVCFLLGTIYLNRVEGKSMGKFYLV